MSLDTNKMLERCRKGQWDIEDFDWTKTPEIKLSKEDEIRFCQYFMDMSYIELVAGALFLSLSKKMTDPTLKEIYVLCYEDEERHSLAAHKLCHYFDIHQHKIYTPNINLIRTIPYYLKAIENAPPSVANMIILFGELILDIALLRGINERMPDPLSRSVIEKINADESRHLAMDFFMTEYCSENDLTTKENANYNMFNILDFQTMKLNRYGWPSLMSVLFRPMAALDPTNKQMKGAMRRFRSILLKDSTQNNPTVRNINNLADFFESPIGGVAGRVLRKTASSVSRVDLEWILAGSRENTQIEKQDKFHEKSATQLANEIMDEDKYLVKVN